MDVLALALIGFYIYNRWKIMSNRERERELKHKTARNPTDDGGSD